MKEDYVVMPARPVGAYVGSVIANVVLAFVAWRLPQWWPTLVLPSYQAAVWVILVAAGVQILGNFLFILYDPKWFRALVEVFIHAASLASVITLYVLWPFDFAVLSTGTVVEIAFRIGLVISAIVTVVMLLVRAVQFVVWVLSAK